MLLIRQAAGSLKEKREVQSPAAAMQGSSYSCKRLESSSGSFFVIKIDLEGQKMMMHEEEKEDIEEFCASTDLY